MAPTGPPKDQWLWWLWDYGGLNKNGPPLTHIYESVVTRWWNCWRRIRKVWRGEVCHLVDGGVLRFQKPGQFPVSSLCLTFVGQHVSSQHRLGPTLACLVAAMFPIITVIDSPSQTVSPQKLFLLEVVLVTASKHSHWKVTTTMTWYHRLCSTNPPGHLLLMSKRERSKTGREK